IDNGYVEKVATVRVPRIDYDSGPQPQIRK
ncbi:MAG: hypothetical protein RLZZ123_2766, partial [Pseudomonadota bacterium]